MSSQPAPYPIRMPDELRDALAERARNGGRSLHAEIIGILHEAVHHGPVIEGRVDVDAFAEALAPKLAARLKEQTS